MSNVLGKVTFVAFCLLATSLACVLVARQRINIVPVVRAQDESSSGLKWVEIQGRDPRQPVRVFNIRVGKEEVKPEWHGVPGNGAPLRGDENWLANLSFTVRNKTTLNILFLYIAIYFPEAGADGGRQVELPIVFINKQVYGFSPDDSASPGEVRDAPFVFAPGARMIISLGDYMGKIKQVVEKKRSLLSITRVGIAVGEVVFEGGRMMWTPSTWYCVGGNQGRGPGCGERLDDNYFPGVLEPESSDADQ